MEKLTKAILVLSIALAAVAEAKLAPPKLEDYTHGDIVTVMVGGKLPHIMIVSDKKTAAGVPLAIHNIGSGTQEEDGLFAYPLTGHYRIP
ncbi:MAG: DUF1287 domain-containing protein [Kiritimatiellae bacterium]|nr:DUF1287 domain-containing protein [Kiritimatiellia bacterium]